MPGDSHEVLFSTEEVAARVNQIAQDVDGLSLDSLVVLTVLKGATIFSADLVRAMQTPTEMAFVGASSYHDGFEPGEELSIQWFGVPDIEGRDVLIVEDIVDTGRTVLQIDEEVRALRPQSVRIVSLVNKTERRDSDFQPSFTGFEITDEFIYGYGLDWDQRYRDLPYIALAG